MTIDINFIKFALSLFFVVQKRKTDHKHGYMEDTISGRNSKTKQKNSKIYNFLLAVQNLSKEDFFQRDTVP